RGELDRRLSELDQREREWNETQHRREMERAAQWEKELESLWKSLEERAEQKLRDLAAQASRPARPVEQTRKAAQVTSKLREQAQEELRQSLVAHLGSGGSSGDQAVEGGGASAPINPALRLPVSPHKATVGDTVKLKSL